MTSLSCKSLAMEPGLRTQAWQTSADSVTFTYTMPVHASTPPVNRADEYEEDGSRELVSILNRQEHWKGSLGENTEGAVFKFHLCYEGESAFLPKPLCNWF